MMNPSASLPEDTSGSRWVPSSKRSKKTKNPPTTPTEGFVSPPLPPNPATRVVPSNFTQDPLETLGGAPVSPEGQPGQEGFDINNPPDITNMDTSDIMDMVNEYTVKILSFLFAPFIEAQTQCRKYTDWVCMVFSNGQATTTDEDCLYRNAMTILTSLIGIYIFYNWFFILFYRDEDGHPVETWNVSWSALKEQNYILGFIFKYLVCQVSFLNAVLMKAKQYSHVLGPQLGFMVLYSVIVLFMVNHGGSVLDLIQNSVHQKLDDTTTGLLMAGAFIFAAYTMMEEATKDTDKFMKKYSSIVMSIGTFVLFVMRMLVSYSYIWVAGLLIPVYLLVYSFGGIWLFSKHPLAETVGRIHKFIVKGFEPPPPDKYSRCRPRTWVEWYTETLKWLVNVISRFFFEYVIGALLVSAIYDYYASMGDNPKLRDILVSLTLFMIAIICGYVYKKIHTPTVSTDPATVVKVKQAMGVFDPTVDLDPTTVERMGRGVAPAPVPGPPEVGLGAINPGKTPVLPTIAEPPVPTSLTKTSAEPMTHPTVAEAPVPQTTSAEPFFQGTIAEPPVPTPLTKTSAEPSFRGGGLMDVPPPVIEPLGTV